MLGAAAVAVPAFWVVYRAIDPAYYDPLALRVGYAALMVGLLALTFVNRAVRRSVWTCALVASCGLVVYFTWLGVQNDLDNAWIVGVLTAGSATVLAITPYARSVRGVWAAALSLTVSLLASLVVSGAPFESGLLVGACYVLLAFLGSTAAMAQVRTRLALREQRDQLQARGRLLRTVIDAIPEHVYVKDREGRCLIRNKYSADFLGLDDPSEAVGLTVFDTSEDPEVAADYWAEEDRVMRTGEAEIDFEEPYAYGGETGWLITSRIPLRDDSGAVVGLVGVTRDVTEQKQSRAKIEAQRRLLQTVIDAIPDHIYVKDVQGRATLRNVASAAALGFDDPEEAVGATDAEVWRRRAADQDHVSDIEGYGLAASADDLTVIRTGRPLRDKEERDASGGWLLTTKVPLRGPDGTVSGIVGVSRDITAQKAVQAALRDARDAAEAARAAAEAQRREFERSQRLLRTVIDAIPDRITVKDREGRLLTRNLAAARIMGYETVEESVGLTLLETDVPRDLAERAHAEDLRVMETAEPLLAVETKRTFGEGWKESTKVPLQDESGEVVGLVSVMRDISERKAAEVALREAHDAAEAAREAAEAATRAKSEFLANMSHEIRTPMNGVVGMTSLLLETPLGPEQRDFVETIRTSGDALLTIINDILDFSKIEAGMLSLEEAPFDVASTVEDALDLVAQGAAEKGVELAYVVGDGAPRAVVGDVTRVRQVLVNLLSNAVKFTAEGSVCVRVGGAPPDAAVGSAAELTFAVEDTGIGIAPGKLEAVFESFSQADASTTREYGGTGLGLAICQSLVGMMGGEMTVASVVGEGSTFGFSMPTTIAASERRVFLQREQPALEGRRVLVVDDNAVNREILTRLSARWRMVPDEVRSGPEALEAVARAKAEGRPYDLILLDMQMPGMDGIGVAQALDAQPGQPPVMVMLTSIHRGSDLRERARAAGVHAVLYKPTKPSQLYDVLIGAFEDRPAPAVAGPSAPAAWVARGAVTTETPPSGPTLRVLLAEDNLVNQKVATRLLDRVGIRADVVANGLEAVEAVERQAAHGQGYDVVFMDVQMPEMDGLAATRAIRALPLASQPHVVALTANAMEGDREACLEAGTDDYLSKPVQLDGIRSAIEQARRALRAVQA
ncbi:response regulator [Rubrivirga sp. IMCC45206]|uniref:PAS domain-containing hybrid sensor histidine kinase/response regulator n=1 Tax=Rubrivirga sp. IMCC45206 TaxID=3391614 RepID=UPI0039902699